MSSVPFSRQIVVNNKIIGETRPQQVKRSYGILCFTNNLSHVLLIAKAHSYAFNDACRIYGRIKSNNVSQCFTQSIVDNLYIYEKQNLIARQLKPFNNLSDSDQKILEDMIRKSETSNNYIIEIPKGHKKGNNETDIDAALREFHEETGIEPNVRNICIYNTHDPHIVTHVDDNIKYVCTYYMAKLLIDIDISTNCRIKPEAFREVLYSEWVSIETIRAYINDIKNKKNINYTLNNYLSVMDMYKKMLEIENIIKSNSRKLCFSLNYTT